MWILSLSPFALQILAIAFDEGYFHIRRGLPKWERIGHPIDTLSVLACLLFVVWVPFSEKALWCYILLAAFSSFLVTKDEFVHKEHCPAAEQWLHAVLFTLHPITLICLGIFWALSQGVELPLWLVQPFSLPFETRLFFKLQLGAMSLFFFYQVFFWNVLWKDKPVLK
jgi:hypothetical protein